MNKVNIDFQIFIFIDFLEEKYFYPRKTDFYERQISAALPSIVVSWLSK
jgi:hypothetical protein